MSVHCHLTHCWTHFDGFQNKILSNFVALYSYSIHILCFYNNGLQSLPLKGIKIYTFSNNLMKAQNIR